MHPKKGNLFGKRGQNVKSVTVGQYHKLYYEVDTSVPGRKAATINIGLQAGLMTTPISNKGFRDITISCNLIPASLSSMHNIANKNGSATIKHNSDDMKDTW